MTPEPWLYGIGFVIGILYLVVLAWVHRCRRSTSSVGIEHPESVAAEPPADGGAVICPDCGNENDDGYRFCRNCVAELPGGTVHLKHESMPTGRNI